MHRFIRLISVVVVMAGCLLMYFNGNAGGKHLSGEACNSCHLTKGKVQRVNAHKLIATQEQLCGGVCHSKATVASHPSGIIPSQTPPKEHPLDWKGELTCSTCHKVHGKRQGLLRNKKRGRDYCMSCHDEDFFKSMSGIIASGHLDARPSPVFTGTVDSFSLQCLGCHSEEDGMMNVSLGAGGIVNHSSRKGNHPIGREYSKAADYGGFRPAAMLPEHIPIPEGMVSCISCHQGYSRTHGKLVMSLEGSALCFSCHDM